MLLPELSKNPDFVLLQTYRQKEHPTFRDEDGNTISGSAWCVENYNETLTIARRSAFNGVGIRNVDMIVASYYGTEKLTAKCTDDPMGPTQMNSTHGVIS